MSTRLPGAKYKRVFDRGRSLKGRCFVAWWKTSADADRMAGVVVSKKTFRLAVDRNRAKRLLREAFRLLAKEGGAPDRTEWIFVARRAIGNKRCADVLEEMRWCVGRLSSS
jgi:ribonuclease P protein component